MLNNLLMNTSSYYANIGVSKPEDKTISDWYTFHGYCINNIIYSNM